MPIFFWENNTTHRIFFTPTSWITEPPRVIKNLTKGAATKTTERSLSRKKTFKQRVAYANVNALKVEKA
jgi:hypothetical protein